MNAADLARLTLAKRAFKATQPSAAEVQTGVRRARLALGRAKPRHRWFSKGLVFVVLAVGSLAYAKPQALGELVDNVRPREAAGPTKRLARGSAREPVEAALRLEREKVARRALDTAAPASAVPTPAERPSRVVGAASAGAVAAPTLKATAASVAVLPNALPPTASLAHQRAASAAGGTEAAAGAATSVVSDWGRVGQALARGDDSGALAALNGLAESDDQRTRDKADLGRAQLLMAHGNPEKACSLARSLTQRRAGGRIERQAQLLLKSCRR
jgi:hypothetical protein